MHLSENVETRFCFAKGKTCDKLPLCLDGTLKSCYNNNE